ncbi:hypothetical protein TNCV_1710401 [Trichonephila clavipes]|nr:hypothetical protein TNCV_1710401 [Trichonephila clavipes]
MAWVGDESEAHTKGGMADSFRTGLLFSSTDPPLQMEEMNEIMPDKVRVVHQRKKKKGLLPYKSQRHSSLNLVTVMWSNERVFINITFSATRIAIGDDLCNFILWPSDEDKSSPSPNIHSTATREF